MRNKRIIVFMLFIVLLVSATGCTLPFDGASEEQVFLQGNTNGNIHNGGFVIVDDGWIYFTNHDENTKLYKEKLDGTEEIELSRYYCCEINLVGQFLYYTSGSPGEIHRVSINGMNDNTIINKKTCNMIVTNESIFYVQAFDNYWGKLYKADLKGKNEVLLANDVIEFAVSDGQVYYSNDEDGASLYKMDFDGMSKKKLNNEYSADIDVDGDYVYYTAFHDGQKLYRMKNDGTEKTLLSQDACWNVNLNNGYLYYRNNTKQGQIYRMKLDGSENQVLIDQENCTYINVTDQFLIYCIPQSTGGYYRADLDGSNVVEWSNIFS